MSRFGPSPPGTHQPQEHLADAVLPASSRPGTRETGEAGLGSKMLNTWHLGGDNRS